MLSFLSFLNSLPPFWHDFLNAVLIGIIGLLAAAIVSFLFTRLARKSWGRYIGNLLALMIVLYTGKVILDEANVVGVVVVLGTALTGALALGSENFASDIVSGLKLFTIRPFKVGDIVSVASGTLGEVGAITLTYTALLDCSGNRVIIRNSDIAAGKIVNYSAFPVRRVEVEISIPVNQDVDKATAAILEGIKDFSPESANEKTSPGLCSTMLWDGMVKMNVYAYVAGERNMDDLEAEKSRLLMTIVQALKKNHINLEPPCLGHAERP